MIAWQACTSCRARRLEGQGPPYVGLRSPHTQVGGVGGAVWYVNNAPRNRYKDTPLHNPQVPCSTHLELNMMCKPSVCVRACSVGHISTRTTATATLRQMLTTGCRCHAMLLVALLVGVAFPCAAAHRWALCSAVKLC